MQLELAGDSLCLLPSKHLCGAQTGTQYGRRYRTVICQWTKGEVRKGNAPTLELRMMYPSSPLNTDPYLYVIIPCDTDSKGLWEPDLRRSLRFCGADHPHRQEWSY